MLGSVKGNSFSAVRIPEALCGYDFFLGTFLPFLRALDNPIAIDPGSNDSWRCSPRTGARVRPRQPYLEASSPIATFEGILPADICDRNKEPRPLGEKRGC
jgi:hypothetical protein